MLESRKESRRGHKIRMILTVVVVTNNGEHTKTQMVIRMITTAVH